MKRRLNLSLTARFRLACTAMLVLFEVGSEAVADDFQNLGFESAVIETPLKDSPYIAVASRALPSWIWANAGQYILYDDIALDAPCISIHDGYEAHLKPLEGNYLIVMQNGRDQSGYLGTWLAQTGVVPPDAKSLMFSTDFAQYAGQLIVSFQGTVIPMRLYSVGDPVNDNRPVETFIGDISPFAGQEGELRFDLTPDPHTLITLDAIEFSPIVSPEPSSFVLLVIASLMMFVYMVWPAHIGGI
jgi:hypothetical protein